MSDFNQVWLDHLALILEDGDEVSPRGELTKEIPQKTIVVDTRRPVLTIPTRKLSYQFMAAEAFWILVGDYRVHTIAPYNKHISQFSDDGVTFAGAYGPEILDQINYVIGKLIEDPDTRQAGLTIWKKNPKPSKDIPCTVAIFFNIRNGKVNSHVFMRSSDAWLGIPYDVFNFSMLTHGICAFLQEKGGSVEPGNLYLTAASSHLYEEHFEIAAECINHGFELETQPPTPEILFNHAEEMITWLKELRDTKPGHELRWWETEGMDNASS